MLMYHLQVYCLPGINYGQVHRVLVFGPMPQGEREGEVAFFSAKRWDRRNRADLIESATPCHDAQMMGLYRDSNPLRPTVLAAMSEDYTTAPQHLQRQGQNAELDFSEKKFREFRVLVFGPIHRGQSAELDFAELVCQHKKLFLR